MRLRDFRIGWRLLIREPAYSAVVILGLSIGFAACFLLLSFVQHSRSYDASVPDAERIYLLKSKSRLMGNSTWGELTPLPYLEVAQRSGLVESMTVLHALHAPMKIGVQVHEVDLSVVQASFPQIFGIAALEGDLQAALTRPDMLALTANVAGRLFAGSHALGKSLQMAGKSYVVAAILADPPSNSTISYGALTGVNTTVYDDNDWKSALQNWLDCRSKIYVKLKPGSSLTKLSQILREAADQSPLMSQIPPDMLNKLGKKGLIDIRLTALPEVYFDTDTANQPGSSKHGDRRTVFGLAAVALLILLLAATNYVNLTTVQTLRRQREIATYKVLGATLARLAGKFLAESLLVSLAATGLGLLLAYLLLPIFSELVDRQLDQVFTPVSLLLSLVLGIAVGLAAGIYPAWVALQVRPAHTLSGRGSSETVAALRLRRVLTVVQFATAMALIGVTLAIAWQTRFASQADRGFDPTPLLVVELPHALSNPQARALRAALARIPGVTGVASAADPVGRALTGPSFGATTADGKHAMVAARPVSINFFEVYGIHALAGTLFVGKIDEKENKDDVCIINASALAALGFETAEAAVGQTITAVSIPHRIVGVVPDIQYESLREHARPMFYAPVLSETSILTVRSTGDMRELESAADALRREYFPNEVVKIRRAQSYFAESYLDDLHLAKLLGLASLVSILIAACGIYVLSAYGVQRRAREIVMRKLHGASRRDIAQLLAREIMLLLVIAAVVALPLAALANARYLANFVERAPVGGWTLLVALLLATLVAALSSARHTWQAMRLSPAAVLKNE